ncbi:MAG: alpha/beta hydrolase [Bacteroidia bacterium]
MRYLLITLLFSTFCFAQTPLAKSEKPFTIGESVSFFSEALKEDRTLNVYLPGSYHPDSSNRYPVIYVLDGSADEDFIHIAGLVQFGSFPWINMLPEAIVVGIANVDRRRDFTYPTQNEQDKMDFPTTGSSVAFIRFLEKEMQPFVEDRYRCDSSKTIIGQSLGGLLAAEVLYKKPQLFNKYIIVSPSLWWDDESLLKKEAPVLDTATTVYIAVGKEGKVMERTAKALSAKIDERNTRHPHLFFQYWGEQGHGNILHLAVYQAFEKMFK